MSVDTASMPPWKLALLERKRRQEEEELERMKEESSRMAEMPTWKRDLLLKKKHQDNSLVFLADGEHNSGNRSSDHVDHVIPQQQRVVKQEVNNKNHIDGGENITLTESEIPSTRTGGHEYQRMSQSQGDEKTVVDEPLIPIEQNPWFKSDHVKKRHSPRSDENKNRIIENDKEHGKNASYRRSLSDDNVSADNIEITEEISDKDSDNEEIYQPGFVSKLLNKFLHMTSPKDDVKNIPKSPVEQVPNRSHSLENLLDEKAYHPLSPRERDPRNDTSQRKTQTMGKAVSMENIFSKQKGSNRLSSSSLTSPVSPISLARDDIIIIEASHPELERLSSSEEQGKQSEKGGKDLRNLVRDSAPTELPRPNFVMSTRTLFESSVDTLKLKKKRAPSIPKQEVPPSKPTQPVQPIRQSSVDSIIADENVVKTIPNNNHQNEVKNVPIASKDKSLHSNKSTNLPNGVGVISNVKSGRSASRGSGKTDSAVHNIKKAGKSWNFGPSESEKSTRGDVDPEILAIKTQKDTEITKGYISNVNNKTHSVSSSTVKNHTLNQTFLPQTETSNISENSNGVLNHTNKENNNIVNAPTITDSVQLTSSSSSSIKKRQAPQPPAVAVSTDELQKKASNISKSWSTRNAEHELEQEKNTLKEQNKTPVISNKQPKVQTKSDAKTTVTAAPTPTNTTSNTTVTSRVTASGRKPQEQKKSKKKPGPGKFSIRPASNLVVAPNRYNSYTVTKPDSDIPVTNIDDIPDDVPFTNIDDIEDEPLSPNGTDSNGSCPPEVTRLDLSFTNDSSETDSYDSPKPIEIPPCRIVFEGAGVQTGKSSFSKSSNKKLKLTFNDDATSTYEYPSEQWLLEQFPPEQQIVNGLPDAVPNDGSKTESDSRDSSGNLLSNPAIGSSGGLSSYKSKVQVEFQFGSDAHKDKTAAPTRPEPVKDPEDMQIKPADENETSAWSNSATSDMLF